MAQKPVLGKGLASLLPNANTPAAKRQGFDPSSGGEGAITAGQPTTVEQVQLQNKDRHPGIALLAVSEIKTNPYQPRREFDEAAIDELAQSIQSNGVIQPLIVRKVADGYELIAGERRLRASKKAGLKSVPVVIRKSTDKESLEIALIENIQRRDLNCIDEALAYFQLLEEFSLTQEQIATQVGKDRATISNTMRLLKLPEAIVDDLKRQILSFGHGKALLSTEDREIQLLLRKEIVEKHLSVRETENRIKELKLKNAQLDKDSNLTPSQTSESTPEGWEARIQKLQIDLARIYGIKIQIEGGANKGKLQFKYQSKAELDRLLESLLRS